MEKGAIENGRLFLSDIKSEHTGGISRRGLLSGERARQPEQPTASAHPYSEIARRNHTNPSPQNASVTRKPTPLPGKRQTFAARLRPIARPASARALLSP
jgi:hypothetical protein